MHTDISDCEKLVNEVKKGGFEGNREQSRAILQAISSCQVGDCLSKLEFADKEMGYSRILVALARSANLVPSPEEQKCSHMDLCAFALSRHPEEEAIRTAIHVAHCSSCNEWLFDFGLAECCTKIRLSWFAQAKERARVKLGLPPED